MTLAVVKTANSVWYVVQKVVLRKACIRVLYMFLPMLHTHLSPLIWCALGSTSQCFSGSYSLIWGFTS